MKKILFIFGTRPEAIKMAPLIKETGQSRSLGIEICVTGQHREMLDQVLKLFDICPDYDLNIMQPGQDLYDITSRILINLRDILQQSKPDLVLVHGDTTTSMAAASRWLPLWLLFINRFLSATSKRAFGHISLIIPGRKK